VDDPVHGERQPQGVPLPHDRALGTPRAAFPAWSPDGDWIVVSIEYPDSARPWDLYRVRPDGTELTQLTDTPTLWEISPDWTD
jgi:hypothetical protein